MTRKITRAAARIALGLQEKLYLGNLDAKRDWGHARDFVRMQWLMLQQDKAEDFVVATGEQHSVREFAELAFAELGINLTWEGQGVDEVGRDDQGKIRVQVDPLYFRPTEVESLLGDPSKARKKLGWVPEISLQDMVREMVHNDYTLAQRDKLCNDHGYDVCSFHE